MSESLLRILLLAHLAATVFMTGVIWFVQVVHYPLFSCTGSEEFQRYEERHTALTTWLVAPPMLIELTTGMLLLCVPTTGLSAELLWMGMGLLAFIWLTTALVQVPCHRALSSGFDSIVHSRLVWSNWSRTAAWSLRGVVVLWLIAGRLR